MLFTWELKSRWNWSTTSTYNRKNRPLSFSIPGTWCWWEHLNNYATKKKKNPLVSKWIWCFRKELLQAWNLRHPLAYDPFMPWVFNPALCQETVWSLQNQFCRVLLLKGQKFASFNGLEPACCSQLKMARTQRSRSRRRGSSTLSLTARRNRTASRPSIRRWSYVRATYIMGLTRMFVPITTGRFWIECIPRIADCMNQHNHQ